jgi:hypothetical protein
MAGSKRRTILVGPAIAHRPAISEDHQQAVTALAGPVHQWWRRHANTAEHQRPPLPADR